MAMMAVTTSSSAMVIPRLLKRHAERPLPDPLPFMFFLIISRIDKRTSHQSTRMENVSSFASPFLPDSRSTDSPLNVMMPAASS